MANFYREARLMTSVQKVSGRLLLPWLPSRWGSDLQALREIVARGDIGRIYRIHRAVYPDAVNGGESRSGFETEVEEMTVGGNIYGDEYEIYRHIARVIHGEEQYFAAPDDALELSRILDAARMSSRLNQTVYLR